ncbi:MAG: DegV family EDD domain-containing protein [Gemmatimonadota bacterium]|nr:DegV family EDD domain-containing protein [Gemmatimonadota bacterium]
MQIAYLDGPRLRRSLIAACEFAQRQRAELNRINVFPVPDGDTGTNLALTVRAISDHLRANEQRAVSAVAYDAAQGAVLGARGNCGMMLSHFLLGFAESVAHRDRITTGEFGEALRAGVDKLYGSLENPVEGTILSVMRDSASAARASDALDFVPLVDEVVAEARESLARTPEQLAVLKRAGVVDAGAKGFVSMLEGVWYYLRGVVVPDTPESTAGRPGGDAAAAAMAEYPTEEEQYRYCTEALVRGPRLPTQTEVQAVLREQGDSLIVIRSDEVLKIHVHTDEPERVFEYLRGVGTLVTHKAEDMRVQHEALGSGNGGHIRLARRPVAIVTDSACDLSEEIVRAHGIHVVPMSLVDGDEVYLDGVDLTAEEFHRRLRSAEALPTTSQPAPASFLDAFERASEEGEEVVGIFVSSTLSGTLGAAEAAAARLEGRSIHVVDSLGNSLLEGLLVLKAAELGELGWKPDAIATELRRVRAQSGILFTVSSFDRLIASGRVSLGKAMLGRFLRLKPILGMTPDGGVEAFGKAFGDARARPELLRIMRSQIPPDVEKVRFGIVHVGLPEIIEPVTRALTDTYGEHVEVLSGPATPVISTHLGIGAWGLAYMVED